MAFTPGILTHWPWECLGNFKYVIVAPFAIHSIYLYVVGSEDRDLGYLAIIPFMLWRMLHNQIWISFSRYRTAKGNNLIVDKSLEFEQVDRERNWFHSLHHTQFRTNYSLFMPFYDYIYGSMDKSTDTLHETSLKKPEDIPDVVHLTHLTTPQSVYHLRLGFAALASEPLTSKWYLWLMWPLTLWSMILTWIYGRTFIIERNTFKKLKAQAWAIPRYNIHYVLQWQRAAINKLIEEAILEADKKGIKVVTLGLLNQEEHLNRYGELYLERHPKLKVKVVDGSSLAVAVVLNSIPKGTSQIVFRGRLSKVAYSIVSALCHKGIQVSTLRSVEYEKLKNKLPTEDCNNLALSVKSCNQKVWLVGEDLTEHEQSMASKGTIFIPFSQFPPKKTREDCFYMNTPSLVAPKIFGNLHSCENWLPRRVISARRVAGILHALEGWNVNECGDTIIDIDKVWGACLQHGFRPSMTSST
ncbi:very-long-chain aldehyde decarbonylase CER1 isoform X2 [Beta vulgaris subsp. vulgaris]|uniref:very-long-chain aldehyde decarbonylase CER1 isoform X2 n=1 Tax=Beta vulgaris subsp. vulgaris TaxID=3555 RepID=UPI0020375A84|nr:very-long-chain aldehyde decarbonylase CER1 isoform X2 [Beta vulgaris subsp. vulgaris]